MTTKVNKLTRRGELQPGRVVVTSQGIIRFHADDLRAVNIHSVKRVAIHADDPGQSTLWFGRGGEDDYKLQGVIHLHLPAAAILRTRFGSQARAVGIHPVSVDAGRLRVDFKLRDDPLAGFRAGKLTEDVVRELAAEIHYRDWRLHVGSMGDGSYIQWRFADERSVEHSGRKWYVSTHATPGEVLRTALAAAIAAEEHEARERFTFRDKAIFHPHHSIEAYLSIADQVEARR